MLPNCDDIVDEATEVSSLLVVELFMYSGV